MIEKNMNEINFESVYIPSPKIVTREIEGELIIVPIESGVADLNDALYSLNTTGREVWNLLDKNRNVNNICSILAKDFSAPIDKINSDVKDLLTNLFISKLIIKY